MITDAVSRDGKLMGLKSIPQKKASSGLIQFPKPGGPVSSAPQKWSYQVKAGKVVAMWQGWSVYSLFHLLIFHQISTMVFFSSNTLLSVLPLQVVLNKAWPTLYGEGSWGCSFPWRTRSWMQRSVPPRTWRRWALEDWGRTANCHPGRPGSGEAGAV